MKLFYPLTNEQRAIWTADHLYPGTSQNNLTALVGFTEAIDHELMNEAYNLAVRNNDALRIRLIVQDGIPKQYFSEYSYKDYDVIDFRYQGSEIEYKNWENELTHKPFQIINSELFYFAIVKIGERTICVLNFHHIIIDAWGIVLLIRKIIKEYWQLKHGMIELESEAEPSFIEQINAELNYLSSKRFSQQREFWQSVFATVPEFMSCNGNRAINSLEANRKTFVMSLALSTKLRNFCLEHNVSRFSVFYSLLALYVYKRTSKKDIVIGTPVLNRKGTREKNTVGMFMHNIPTRICVEPNYDYLSFVAESFGELKKFLKNQRYPYGLILKDFRERHQFSGALMDITLNYHNATYDSMIPYEGTWNYCGAQTNSLSLSVSDRADTGIPVLDYDYLLEVFNEEDIVLIHKGMCSLLEEALDDPTKKISELQMMDENELGKLITGFNQTSLSYEPKSIVKMFEEQADKTPNNTAIVFGERTLNYRELNEKANQLARIITKNTKTKKTIISLCVNRSLEMIIGILGILKAGCAYLPIDPSYPKERISYILTHSKSSLILTDSGNEEIITEPGYDYLNISLENNQVYNMDTSNLDLRISTNNLAYVLYTSGSTGNPKGVMVPHKALCNLIIAVGALFDLQGKTIISLTTISFDIFFLETILPLTYGMRVIIANEDQQIIPRLFFELLKEQKVDILQTTPSRMKLILNEDHGRECLNDLCYLLIGGETFPSSLLAEIRKATQAEVYNMYGPTETTVWSTAKKLVGSEKITIGKPIANTQVYILDDRLSPVQVGTEGDIYISGDGVSLGYLNNVQLSEKSFIANPFIPGQIMYKTGDLGRWLSNGEIEFLGRNDEQIKIRGFRVELEEVEECLERHGAVNQTLVVAQKDSIGRIYLCAYYTGVRKLSSDELKSFMLKFLPNYMLPVSFTWLSHIPQTPNGKIDRNALPVPAELLKIQTSKIYVAPRNDIEAKLALLWAEALEVDRVGIDDNLFAFGGDSLTILEIMSGALEYTWKLNAQDFYECPTIRNLSMKIEGNSRYNGKIPPEIYFPKRIIKVCDGIPEIDNGHILLTGATGFLGIHLLMELLYLTKSELYCLLRGENPLLRLYEELDFYFGSYPADFKDRIKVITGDISIEKFGLDDQQYYKLAQDVGTIIHCAALTKHYGNYTDFEKVNIKGTSEVINFCLKFDKNLQHISTISISGNYLADEARTDAIFKENDFYIGQDISNFYVRSKFEAENLVFQAENNGLKANIFRVGIIAGRYSDGKSQRNIEDNALYRRLKTYIILKAVPANFLNHCLELTPVDLCARGIAKIISANRNHGLVFHMLNHKMLQGKEFLKILADLNFNIRVLADKAFNSYIIELSKSKFGKNILSGIITDVAINGLSYNGKITIDSKFTVDYLSKLDFKWPEIEDLYIKKIIQHMLDIHFINENYVDNA
jgi:amino acid adenylation domain-containing protein/thioester reductase-like protein